MPHIRVAFVAICLLSASLSTIAAQPDTMRIDYHHSGNALQDIYSLDKVVKEPLPWPGNLDQRIGTLNRGAYFFEVVEPVTGEVLYSRGFSSIFGEWRTTAEARQQNRSFSESLRFPMPDKPVRIRLYDRDDRNAFSMVWTLDIDPASTDVRSAHEPLASPLVAIRKNGNPQDKVDLLILGDGYTEGERKIHRRCAAPERCAVCGIAVQGPRERFQCLGTDGGCAAIGHCAPLQWNASMDSAGYTLRCFRQ